MGQGGAGAGWLSEAWYLISTWEVRGRELLTEESRKQGKQIWREEDYRGRKGVDWK